MSLNWKEINLILEELRLPGLQIQKAVQSNYEVLALRLYGRGEGKLLLIALSPGACRLHETRRGTPKNDKPLRFAEFLNSRIVNGRIEEAVQLGDNRIVRLSLRRGEESYRLYIRLWSNAANVVVTGEDGRVLDAMRRLPKRDEISGGFYRPEESLGYADQEGGPRSSMPEPGGSRPSARAPLAPKPGAFPLPPDGAPPPRREYHIRDLPGEGSFNERVDAFYAEQGGALSLESLREEARRSFEGRINRLGASLEKLRAKETEFASAERLREYGDLILANTASVKPGDGWLEAENFFEAGPAGLIRIKLDSRKSPAANAESYYSQYRKAKSGLEELRAEIAAGEAERAELENRLERLLAETNPLSLHKLLRGGGEGAAAAARRDKDRKRPGLSFRRGDWLIMVGRDAAENDALLRRHVKGNDLWLHVRDFPGSYVFIKQRAGKSYPLELLLDAGNLALFYSKGRNNGEADLFYTPVKYLRRAKDGPKGLVLPTQEKNLHIKTDEGRLKELERCRVEK
jgi:predicted ribosome quality control (RQC) complex YloA/Tae2 family protein